ncbi:Chromate resistance protein ChrB [Prauserella sp. PE36]|uniref:Chromate resistance protein ChrB n=1 Tax=Prauserella sp. PE36 TaxID=1504709 RepID=UPI001F20AE2E|nr:Chromate resistance protein ChrB [Prauserella sp. PE36]
MSNSTDPAHERLSTGSAAQKRAGQRAGQWVLLSYRMPREPSTPRITVWRKLKRLGVAQLGDGLVALPADARTREHLDWIAEEILAAGGTADVWLAQPTSLGQERGLAQTMAAARAAEYRAVLTEAEQARSLREAERRRALRTLRAELRRIHRRDYFPPPERDTAQAAVDALHPDLHTEETA